MMLHWQRRGRWRRTFLELNHHISSLSCSRWNLNRFICTFLTVQMVRNAFQHLNVMQRAGTCGEPSECKHLHVREEIKDQRSDSWMNPGLQRFPMNLQVFMMCRKTATATQLKTLIQNQVFKKIIRINLL